MYVACRILRASRDLSICR